jgi:chromate reductase
LEGKPVAILGATTGMMATVRSQLQLRQTCLALNMLPPNRPEVMIPQAPSRFGEDGSLKDQTTAKFLAELTQALYDWTLRLKACATT